MNVKKGWSILFLAAALAGCITSRQQPPAAKVSGGWQLQDAAFVSAAGPAISQPDYQPAHWHDATVPGTVLTSLVNDGIYAEPLYGENNRPDKIPDSLCRTSYWYRQECVIPSDFAGRHVWLNFAGINYQAEVFVNGARAGDINGAFSRGRFDITPFVHPGQTAAIAVHILPPPHPGTHAEKTVQSGTGPNGGILAEDGPTFLCSIGWDWIPTIRDRDIGIWAPVTLSATGPVALRDPYVTSDLTLPSLNSADLTIQATAVNVTDLPQTGVLHASFDDVALTADVSLKPHESRTVSFNPANSPQLHLHNPRLWWPNGYGDPNLYALHLDFDANGKQSDSRDLNFGIRKITYTLPGSDNLALCVNGVPVVAKGGDWGMDEAMKRIDRPRLEAQIRMHQLANFNIIRNWVGQSTSDDFYDLCDKYGIMVWDEMFQPNPSDGPNPLDVPLYLANVREKILRYRNHPCIALWCGRNEGDPPPAIDAGIRAITTELNPDRLYQPNSRDGRGVRSGGPYLWRTPRAFYQFPDSEAFKTEIGSVSIPTVEAVEAMMPSRDWNTVNDDWAEHDLTHGAQEARRRGDPLFPDTLAQRYGEIVNLPDFVRKGNLATYEAFRAMYEGRFAKMFHPVTGVITWMSNPAQPSFVWQIYSHDLEPNAALFAARKACEPVHIQMNQSDFHVMIVNNTPIQLAGLQARMQVYNMDASLKLSQTSAVTAAASATTDLGVIPWPAGLSPVHFVELELRDASGALLSDNFYWRAPDDRQDDFVALNSLPTTNLDVTAIRHDESGRCKLDVTLSNLTSNIALMTHLQLHRRVTGQRVLPAYYSDNYLSLLPGQVKTVTIDAALSDLAGQQPLVEVDGWNVTVSPWSSPDAGVALNAQAQVSAMPAGFTVLRPEPAPAAP